MVSLVTSMREAEATLDNLNVFIVKYIPQRVTKPVDSVYWLCAFWGIGIIFEVMYVVFRAESSRQNVYLA